MGQPRWVKLSLTAGGLTNFIDALKHRSSAGRTLRTQPVQRAAGETRGEVVMMVPFDRRRFVGARLVSP